MESLTIWTLEKNHSDIDGVRYQRDASNIDSASNGYLDKNRNLKLFCEKYVGVELLNTFISYTDLKTKYPIQAIDLRFWN